MTAMADLSPGALCVATQYDIITAGAGEYNVANPKAGKIRPGDVCMVLAIAHTTMSNGLERDEACVLAQHGSIGWTTLDSLASEVAT